MKFGSLSGLAVFNNYSVTTKLIKEPGNVVKSSPSFNERFNVSTFELSRKFKKGKVRRHI